MNVVISLVFEVLGALASVATVVGFILERWEKHKRQRIVSRESRETGGHRSL